MHNPLKPRLLSIDDEPAVGALLRAWFERSGDFSVATESTSRAALATANAFKPDLILMDVNMPGLSGPAIVKQMRAEPWLRHRPVIFYSGMSQLETNALHAGFGGPTEFILKGVPLSVVETAVRRLLAERLKQYRAAE